MSTNLPEYKPLSKEVWDKVTKLWEIYKRDVGLAGDMYLELNKRNLSAIEIANIIDSHFNSPEIQANLEAWHELRGMNAER